MKNFIDKLISELKAGRNKECANNVPYIRLCDAISIVNELAEEYKDKDCSQCSRRKFYQQGYEDAKKEYINTSTDTSEEQPTWQQQTMNRFERVD